MERGVYVVLLAPGFSLLEPSTSGAGLSPEPVGELYFMTLGLGCGPLSVLVGGPCDGAGACAASLCGWLSFTWWFSTKPGIHVSACVCL